MAQPLIFLASNSPRRRQLIALTGWNFQVNPANVDESQLPGEDPRSYVLRLAETKARAVTGMVPVGAVILAADTIVVDGNEILGKPQDEADARRILVQLRGRSHQVYTALAVLDPRSGRLEMDLCVSQVPMRAYADEELEAYLKSGDPFDKAGAYAIQHPDFHPVVNFNGCYASVMGLPLCHLARTMRKLDVTPRQDVPRACQASLQFTCSVFGAIEQGEEIG